jgi:hypothetical protein
MAGSGYDGSVNYAVGYMNTFGGIYPRIQLTGNAKGKMVSGCFVTNSTYAYYDMKNGSGFSKKFGGTAGSDPDYLKMTASGYLNGMKINQKATFYLADFTSQDSTKDYILKEWRWFDLSSLGNVDSIEFTLESSDTGSFGMNTPAYFCMDHFITKDMALTVSATYTSKLTLYPNPAHDVIYTTVSGLGYGYNVYQLSGALVSKGTLANGQIDFSGTTAGIYIVEIISEQGSQFHKVNIR